MTAWVEKVHGARRWHFRHSAKIEYKKKISYESLCLKPLFHSSQKPTRKLAASAFKYCDWMEVLAASLRVGFCDE